MPNYRLTLAYDGTDFRGWALQPGFRTVAADLAAALVVEPNALTVAGRTDAGVHAAANVVSLRAPRLRSLRAVNRRLPPDIALLEAERAADGFNARADARARSYVYRILTAERPDPFRARYELHHPGRRWTSPRSRPAPRRSSAPTTSGRSRRARRPMCSSAARCKWRSGDGSASGSSST